MLQLNAYSSLYHSKQFLKSLKYSPINLRFSQRKFYSTLKPENDEPKLQYIPQERMKLKQVTSFGELKRFLGHYSDIYKALSKPKLSLFVMMSQGLGFLMAPIASGPVSGTAEPSELVRKVSKVAEAVLFHFPGVSSDTSASLSTLFCDTLLRIPPFLPEYAALLVTTFVGTSLCVASANIFNQWIEWPFDAQMKRTRNRMLVQYKISTAHAFTAGTLFGAAGVGLLAVSTNWTVTLLGLGNILLYAAVYTPMKRLSIYNTWVGAIVGGIPPLMGWAAVTNGSLVDLGAWVLFYILYAWQFPHFNSLSWNLQADYTRAGYRMMSVLNPKLCTRTALTYSLALVPVCSLVAPWCYLTTPYFAITSLVPNLFLCYRASLFQRAPSTHTARKLFFASLLHLPVLFVLLLVHKKSEPPVLENAVVTQDSSERILQYPWASASAFHPQCIYEYAASVMSEFIAFFERIIKKKE